MQTNYTPQRGASRPVTLLALLVMLASALLLPAIALAQEPGTTVPQPVEGPPPSIMLVSELPLPAMPPVETEADIAALAQPEFTVATAEELAATTPASYMPLVAKDHAPVQADRMGFGTGVRLSSYTDIRSLYAGWYVNWGVSIKPERPANIEYMQMVRVHQNLECPFGTTADRDLCPYSAPASYSYSPSAAVIAAAAKANPGSTWAIGNEMDRVDWIGGRQDEMVPELYARAYHDIRAIIKAADPTARIAIGGVIQFTPLRKQYLDKVWDTYWSLYGTIIPVDVWNIHNFVASEYCYKTKVDGVRQRVCGGMAIPAGIKVTPVGSNAEEKGAYVGEDWRHTYMPTFEKQILDFRAWMKAHGQINKELVVTEYGVLFPSLCPDKTEAQCAPIWAPHYTNLRDPAVVQTFMLKTFDFFMNKKDCNLSGVDDCRLVQRWAWYSLDAAWDFNPYTALYVGGTNQRSSTGDKYSAFSAANVEALQYP